MSDVRIITEALGGSELSRLIQRGAAPQRWVGRAPMSAAEWNARALARRAEGNWGERLAALAPAFAATGAAADRLERVRHEGGIVVTTGQQPGLFGGPIYTWSKAMSTIALAHAIEASTGVPTAPVFWAATDDADFAEAASAVVARAGGIEVLRSEQAPPPGTPMSLAPLGELEHALRRLRDASGSAADPRPLISTEDAYGDPARTVGDAFVRLLRTLLAPLGMPVLDASHPAVRDASLPTIEAALRAARPIESALAERAAEIRAAGFSPQVEDVPGLSLVFVREATTKRRMTVSEAEAASGGWYTPNVLLRPIVEQAILPTVGYMAGPGELAYFAQVSAVAKALATPAPVALPRWSCTLVEPHVQHLLDRFGITPSDLADPNALESEMAHRAMSPSAVAALARLRAMIAGLPYDLTDESETSGLSAAVQGASESLQHRVDRLERRLVAGVKRRETAQMRDIVTLRAALYPRGVRQERLLNAIPIFARNGLALLDEMSQAAGAHAASLVEPARHAQPVGAQP